jgi:hypothetical protein
VINDKGMFFGHCASSVDVLEHAVCRKQPRGEVCYVPELVDIIYSDALSYKHQHMATDAGRDSSSLQRYAKCRVERDDA